MLVSRFSFLFVSSVTGLFLGELFCIERAHALALRLPSTKEMHVLRTCVQKLSLSHPADC